MFQDREKQNKNTTPTN
jgi:hypothetical protein